MGRRSSAAKRLSKIRKPDEPELQTIIQDHSPERADIANQWAKALGKSLASAGLTMAQVNTIISRLRQIESAWPIDDPASLLALSSERELKLLSGKIAHDAARAACHQNYILWELADVLIPAIGYVEGERENFQRFVNFFEAILGYHEAAGGR